MHPDLAPTVWLAGLDALDVRDEASVALVRAAVREVAARAGLDGPSAESLVTAASELAHNQLAHGRFGRVGVRAIARAGVPGVEVVAADAGDGVLDPTTALRGPAAAPAAGAGSLGIGLAGAQRLSQELDLDVRRGEGTCVRVRRFAAPVPRREVGVLARPCAGERVLGDDALVLALPDGLLLAVADGLGHGPLARDASAALIAELVRAPGRSLEALMDAAAGALRGTRGAVAALARLRDDGDLRVLSVGNITGAVHGARTSRRIGGASHVLGSPVRGRRPVEEHFTLGPHDVFALYSDGLTSRADLGAVREIRRLHPIAIAQQLLTQFERPDDDALVLVVH